MNQINVLIIANEYGSYITKQLLEDQIVNSCFCIFPARVIYDEKNSNLYKSKKVKYTVLEDVEKFYDYENLCNLNSIPALSKELLESMLQHESMILKMGRRRTNYPSVEYEEEKYHYHQALRYWNHIILSNHINFVYMDRVPHYPYSYIIYSLAKIHGIDTMIISNTSIPKVAICMDSIENGGRNIEKHFITNYNNYNFALSGDVKEYYDKYSMKTVDIVKERKSTNYNSESAKYIRKIFFNNYLGLRGLLLLPYSKYITYRQAIKLKDISWYKRKSKYFRWLKEAKKKVRYFILHNSCSIKQYDKTAKVPNFDVKYIYFPLQMTPEETTIPRAGVFSEQYTSIQLIARAAEKCGVKVYVKEHYVQAMRDVHTYEAIDSIPNVTFIKTEVSSFELIDHCIAVATQTGTCILEGAIKGKPSLVTSDGYFWKGLPGCYEIVDENQGEAVIKDILNGIIIDKDDVMRYFYSIEKCGFYYFDPNHVEDIGTEPFMKSLNEQVALIKKRIEMLKEDIDSCICENLVI